MEEELRKLKEVQSAQAGIIPGSPAAFAGPGPDDTKSIFIGNV